MRDTIRTFVAIKIQPEETLIAQLSEFKRIFKRECINWIPEDNFHLTLRFIGDTTREQLYTLVDRLEELALLFDPFDISVEGAGYFSSKGKPRVLLVKIKYPEVLSKLVAGVERAVVETGFHAELKTFRPHLTLGRIKHLESRTRFTEVLDSIDKIEYQHQTVDEFIIYQSILRPEGPAYKPIQKFEFEK